MMIGDASANANDSTRAVRDTARGSKHRTIAGAITLLFRQAVKAITEPAAGDAKEKTRRKGETEGEFRKLARKVARRFNMRAAFGRVTLKISGRRRVIEFPPEIEAQAAHSALSEPLGWFASFEDDSLEFIDFENTCDAVQEYISLEL